MFPDFAPGSFSHSDELDGWVWTTFNTWQWDTNWSNPDVFAEYADIILFLANAGVEVLRLDAIAFVWKRLGTNCQNQPEVHAITQALRAVARIACPAVLFKAEAIVAPQDLVHYLGQGAHHGKVSDIAYHNSLMVQIWSMLATREATLAAHALRAIPPVPSTTTWVTYIRCHDDIGWAIDDDDAAAVGLNGFWHQSFLSDYYSGIHPGSPARGLVFQANPETGDRRISGSAASLAGLDAVVSPGRSMDLVVGRLFLAHAIDHGLGRHPGDLDGRRDRDGRTTRTGPPSPATGTTTGGPTGRGWTGHAPSTGTTCNGAGPGVRSGSSTWSPSGASLPHLESTVAAEVPTAADPGILPVLRRHPLGPLLELFNVTDSWRPFPGWRLAELGLGGRPGCAQRQPHSSRAGRQRLAAPVWRAVVGAGLIARIGRPAGSADPGDDRDGARVDLGEAGVPDGEQPPVLPRPILRRPPRPTARPTRRSVARCAIAGQPAAVHCASISWSSAGQQRDRDHPGVPGLRHGLAQRHRVTRRPGRR